MAVSSAHLAELLSAIDAVNSKAMFLVGLNVASNSLFVAVIASLGRPWWSAVAPIMIALIAVAVGLWTLRQGDVTQFPSPGEMLATRRAGWDDDRTSWMVVAALDEASWLAWRELRRVLRWTYALGALTALQIVCVAATGLVLAT